MEETEEAEKGWKWKKFVGHRGDAMGKRRRQKGEKRKNRRGRGMVLLKKDWPVEEMKNGVLNFTNH